MPDEHDILGAIESLAANTAEKEKALRTALEAMSDRMAVVCKKVSFHHSGESFRLQMLGPDEEVNGYLSCSESGLSIAYRTTQDDLDTSQGLGLEPGCFHVKHLAECPIEWLREIRQDDRLRRFLDGFHACLAKETLGVAEHTTSVETLLQVPLGSLSATLELVAQQLGYDKVVTDWRDAQSAIAVDPDGAITKACSLIETVCKHILGELGEPLPADKSIQPLYKAAAKKLGLDPTGQAEAEMRNLCGGLATATQNIGAVRTKMGDAHGRAAHFVAPATSLARLAVNSAGILATFLMEQWLIRKEDQSAK